MSIKCRFCKSWNCENNGHSSRWCIVIIKEILMEKGLPSEISKLIVDQCFNDNVSSSNDYEDVTNDFYNYNRSHIMYYKYG